MSSQEFKAIEIVDRGYAEKQYQKSQDFFYSTPLDSFQLAPSPAVSYSSTTDSSIATDQGSVQFHLIGQKTDDPKWSSILNENQSNLLAMGGLIHSYMQKNYPTVNSSKLDINVWRNVVGNLPSLSIGSTQRKSYNNNVKGVSVSAEFLSLIARSIITGGSSLLLDFNSFLQSMGDIVFSVNTQSQVYKTMSCTYQSYLLDNGAGGYFDYGAIVLKEIDFTASFMELKGACTRTDYVSIRMDYQESVSLVQTAPIRQGGRYYQLFQNLINADATERFENANNFFNGGNTPKDDIKPQV